MADHSAEGCDPTDWILTEEKLAEIRATMKRYVRNDEPFLKFKIPTREVIELFRQHGMGDKEQLFHYRLSSPTNVYRLGNFIDYYYGYMPPSTGYVPVFDLKKIEGGVLLVLPKKSDPLTPGDPAIPHKLFATMRRTNAWSENIGIPTKSNTL